MRVVHDVAWPVLILSINAADILAQHANTHQLHTTKKEDGCHQRRIPRHREARSLAYPPLRHRTGEHSMPNPSLT